MASEVAADRYPAATEVNTGHGRARKPVYPWPDGSGLFLASMIRVESNPPIFRASQRLKIRSYYGIYIWPGRPMLLGGARAAFVRRFKAIGKRVATPATLNNRWGAPLRRGWSSGRPQPDGP